MSNGEWRLTLDYRGLNEVTPPLSAAMPDMLELQYELESKAAKWYATIDIANVFLSIPLAAECRPQFAFTWRGVQYTWNRLPQGWKHSPTICHGLIQTALEQGEAPEHLQYIDDIIVWGNTAAEVFEKGKKIVQILLKAGFAIKQSNVKGPAQEIQILGIKWQDGRRQVQMDVINKITAMSPPTSKKETQAFLGVGYRGSEACYTPTEKELLAAYEGVRAALEVVGTEAQLLLATWLPVLGWMFRQRVPSTHHATDATWSKWVTLITQQAPIGNPNRPGILEVIMDWPEGKDFGISPEEEVTCAEEAPLYNKLPENEKQYDLFTDGSCRIVGKHRRWKAAVWSPIQQIVETAEGDGESSQFAEIKAIQLAHCPSQHPSLQVVGQVLDKCGHIGRRQIPMDVINKITAMSPPTSKKETQAFLGVVVTRKKNDFKGGPEQRKAFEQIKREIVHAVALGPVRAGQDVKNVLYTAAGENVPTWSLWQKTPWETRGRPLGFCSRGYRGSEAHCTPTEKEILAAYEGVRAALEVVGTEAQLLLAPRLPVLGWMFKGRVPSTATDAMWSKWVALITQRARIGNPNRPGILEVIMDWPEGKDFGISPEKDMTRAEEAPLYNKLPENEKQYALFTDGSCRIVGKHRRWKAAVWSPI
ncbi:hypothetical protein QYF61_004494 [Mycteria americana]|uniref:ribonuclease H n=1 Tax=Mycteria americana TaxID=33587 RepID=A0AAN7NFH7_MYCAM|nr:hypothetical protein QYF61_004494 [Mycteria americana]